MHLLEEGIKLVEDEKHQGGIDVSWSKITSELKKSLDKDTFQNWIKPIYFESHIDLSLIHI